MDSDSGSGIDDFIDLNNINIATVFDDVTQRLNALDRRIVEQHNDVQNATRDEGCMIIERTEKLHNWRNELKTMFNSIEHELYEVRREKVATEKLIEVLASVHKNLAELPAIEDVLKSDANKIEQINVEFKKELDMFTLKQELLESRCRKSEPYITRLETLKAKVGEDVADKDAGPDPMNHKKYAKWVEMTEDYKKNIQAELTDANFMELSLFSAREEAVRDVKAQRDLSLTTMKQLVNTTHLHSMHFMSKLLGAKVGIGQRRAELQNLEDELRLNKTRLESCRQHMQVLTTNSLSNECRKLEQEKAELAERIHKVRNVIEDLTILADAYDRDRLELENAVKTYKLAVSKRKQASQILG